MLTKQRKLRLKPMRSNPLAGKLRAKQARSIHLLEEKRTLIKTA